MFNPAKFNTILDIEDKDLFLLPSAEDERHEYKSSEAKDSELRNKIARAASGFWNSGGGLFVVGVDGEGRPDGGLSLNVGRQARRDWIDQAVSQVVPRGSYVVKSVEDNGAGLNIEPGKAVFLIGFDQSELGPHMANDNCYYIRAGAHTVPASHFIVESIYARRGARTPLLHHIVRRKPANSSIIQLGIVALNAVPAINVSIELDPSPFTLNKFSSEKFLRQVPLISDPFPFFFDIDYLSPRKVLPPFCMNLAYSDVMGQKYNKTFDIDIKLQLGPNLSHDRGNEGILEQLGEIVRELRHLGGKR